MYIAQNYVFGTMSYGHFSYIPSQQMAAILDFKSRNWQITPNALPMDSLYQWT